jgi:hypothetical protein
MARTLAGRLVGALVALTTAASLVADERRPDAQARGARVSRAATCASDLGVGVKSRLRFCDVLVAQTGADSVAMPVPSRSGAATLRFDLHSRVQVQPGVTDPIQAFVRSAAVVAVVKANGDLIERAAVVSEYRGADDLFDRLAGTRPGELKIVAPGPPEPVRVAIPAGVTAIGIVGLRVELMTAAVRAAFDAPGRPVAIVSNLRIEYR